MRSASEWFLEGIGETLMEDDTRDAEKDLRLKEAERKLDAIQGILETTESPTRVISLIWNVLHGVDR